MLYLQNPCSLCFLATKKICVLLLLWKVDLRNMVSLSDPASWKRSSPCPHAMRQEVTDGLVDRTTTSPFVANFWESSPIPWHLHSVQILPQSGPIQEETIEKFLCWVQLQNTANHRFFVVTCSSAVRVSAALMFQVWITTCKLIFFSSSHSFPKLALCVEKTCAFEVHAFGSAWFPSKLRIQHFRAKIVRLTCPTHSDLPSIDSVSGLLHPVGLPACGS